MRNKGGMQKIISAIRQFGAFPSIFLLKDRRKFWFDVLSRQNIADKTQANFVWRTGEFEKIRCEFGDCFYYEFNKNHTFSGFGDTMRLSTGKDGLLLAKSSYSIPKNSLAGAIRWVNGPPSSLGG